MKRTITIDVEIPEDASEDQIEEWLEYELGYCGRISLENPLHAHEIEATTINIY